MKHRTVIAARRTRALLPALAPGMALGMTLGMTLGLMLAMTLAVTDVAAQAPSQPPTPTRTDKPAAQASALKGWPERPIRIVVPYPPGGTTDIVTRAIAKGMSEALNQSVVVENRGGASGMIGTEVVARSPADGYTLLSTGSGPHVVNISLFPRIAYDPVRDFAPISLVQIVPLLMVAPTQAPYDTVAQFIDWARANPTQANYCSIGPGTPSHLAGEMFKAMTKLELTHIAYKGSGPAVIDVAAGVCPVLFDSAVSSGPQVRNGRMKALAISTAQRVASWQDVPTVAESGVAGFDAYTWGALLAPAGTPPAVLDRLYQAVSSVLQSPGYTAMLAEQGAIPGSGTPASLAQFTTEEIAKWRQVIRDGNIKIE